MSDTTQADPGTRRPTHMHPVTAMFPVMDRDGIRQLADDIAINGQQEPIVVYVQGDATVLLDGQNRLAACDFAGIEPVYAHYEGHLDDVTTWIVSRNLHRRHLTVSQRAMIATKLAERELGRPATADVASTEKSGNVAAFPGGADPSPSPDTLTQAEAARALHVSERSVRTARTIQNSGNADLIAKVESGEVTVTEAARQLRARGNQGRPEDLPCTGGSCHDCPTDRPHHVVLYRGGGPDGSDVEVCWHCKIKIPYVEEEPAELANDQRAKFDAYWTPSPHALACCRFLHALDLLPAEPQILEPSIGGGAWARAALDVWPDAELHGVDIDPDAPGLRVPHRIKVGDFLELELSSRDLILGNPPYNSTQILAWLERSLQLAPVVAYLLRETITGTHNRLHWWRTHRPAHIAKLSTRPRWEGPGARTTTDFADSILVVWVHDHTGPTLFDWIEVPDAD